jgi:hemerythrin superfamily protein
MSFLDKIASSIMPPESAEDRVNARSVARAVAGQNDWLATILQHHQQVEAAFAQARGASGAEERMTALKRLAALLSAHANAEEAVIYPMMTVEDQKAHAAMAFEEQAAAKTQLALLETIDPLSQEWRDKLEHVEGAVLHHVYEEEGTWFPKLVQELSPSENQRLTARFAEEFQRFSGGGGAGAGSAFANDVQYSSRQMAAPERVSGQIV